MSLYMVGRLFGHTQYQTTIRYVHLVDAPFRDAANQIANVLTDIVAESLTQSTVLQLVK